VFVNRQKGSGTRVITDYLLKKNGIPPESVNGYNHEEYTHLAVASNVKLGGADCGVGIRYVADALGLDFIPLKKEPYDLIFLKSERNREKIKLLLKFVKDEKFKKLAKKFAGYQYIGGKINEETQ
ncbi:MAG: substrate-binding domain-containing protein, partial [Caldisericaceae bacterium]|nr:substrate-binding domain-containing protein [Caldisericaceae bacterium]